MLAKLKMTLQLLTFLGLGLMPSALNAQTSPIALRSGLYVQGINSWQVAAVISEGRTIAVTLWNNGVGYDTTCDSFNVCEFNNAMLYIQSPESFVYRTNGKSYLFFRADSNEGNCDGTSFCKAACKGDRELARKIETCILNKGGPLPSCSCR